MLLLLALAAASVRIEEPTGIERRHDEVVAVSSSQPCVVHGPGRAPVPTQFTGTQVLFPVSIVPGRLPQYQLTCPAPQPPTPAKQELTARRIGLNRLELANSRFRLTIDLAAGAITEAYNLTAANPINSVDTTPPHTGWTTASQGPITSVDILETGPLRARVRLTRADDEWTLTFTAASPAISWTARKPFRFSAVSATPYIPYDRFVTGADIDWPDGPDESEPPDHDIAPHSTSSGVYYNSARDYGAFGLGGKLEWNNIGAAQFESRAAGTVFLVFPRWNRQQTVLDFRRELRIAMNPLLVTPVGKLRAFGNWTLPVAELHHAAWQLAWGEKGAGPSSEWRSITVPGSAHTQWLPKEDWFTRRAEWVSAKEWWYRTRFKAPPGTHERARIHFEATDYYAETWLNGNLLGRHEGYIDPYEYDVTGKLLPENELVVRVWTPVTYYWRHRPYTIKGSYGAVDQKPDNITPLGITRPVRLVTSNAAYIRDVAVATSLNDDGSATVSADVETSLSGPNRYRLTLQPGNFSSPQSHTTTSASAHIDLKVPNPQLWWTWDHGKPNLYKLRVELLRDARVLDTRIITIGIREIEKIGWTFYLNRKRMFVRGTNYYYGHLFLSEMNRAAYERDIKLMLGMNVNMIRLHCYFANREFYDLADESGVLIWQDFLEAWYPRDTDFSRHASNLYDNHIRYVRNHPSVALWAVSDEEDIVGNYPDLTKHLAARAALLDPQRRPVVRSTGRFGDAHVYHGWYEGSIWDYTKMDEEFVSELGATALPNYDSLITFLPNHWPIREHASDWVFHKLQIKEAMRAWGEPGDKPLREYIGITQDYVARLFQIALERARILRYNRSGGILHFHAIDFWPSVTMAAVDFYRRPTKVYDVVRRSLSPVAVLFSYDADTSSPGKPFSCRLFAVNDTWRPVSGQVRWHIERDGATLRTGEVPVQLSPDSIAPLPTLDLRSDSPGRYRVRVSFDYHEGTSGNEFEYLITPI